MKGFQRGDPRAIAAGRKGGLVKRAHQSLDYIRGYRSGARAATRHLHRWIREQQQVGRDTEGSA